MWIMRSTKKYKTEKGNIKMLQQEIVDAGSKIASDLCDARVSKEMGDMGGHIIKDVSDYDNSDLVQKYLDNEIVSVEAIYLAMKRAEESCLLERRRENTVQYFKLYNQKNKAKIAENSRNWYKKNKDRKTDYDKIYREKNKEKALEYGKIYREKRRALKLKGTL